MVEGDLQQLLDPLASGGCFPLVAPDNQPRPYITYQVIDGVETLLEGGGRQKRIQVDVWADTYEESKSIGRAVVEAAKTAPFPIVFLNEGDDYEADTKTFRQRIDFYAWGEA